jgi:GTPase SAR1 family protein
MLVGEGRAGKTALANSLMGLPFAHTESTCGIEQFRVEVSHAVVGSAWHQCEAPESELDAAIVALARDSKLQPKVAAKSVSVVKSELVTTSVLSSDDVVGGDLVTAPSEHGGPLANMCALDGLVGDCSERLKSTYMTPLKAEAINAALLSNSMFQNSALIVKLFDFAGQDVFSCLHAYFLTQHGAYAIVFNMNWLSTNTMNSAGALEYLSFWLNSVAMNTKAGNQKIAPIFLVGTHKDEISDVAEHIRISELLAAAFSYSAVWPSIIENEESGLVYFPVDCTMGVADSTVVRLMSLIEQSIRASDYLSIKRPLPWYEALDAYQQVTSHALTFTEAKDMAVQCGVNPDRVTELLSFLRDMGMLMWYNEPGLNETIILDPIAYFVKPVTRVICHADVRKSDVHRLCRKVRCKEYDVLYNTGVATPAILNDMLSYGGCDANALILLMLKYGLAMCWYADDKNESCQVPKYFIPPLFPTAPSTPVGKEWINNLWMRTMYVGLSLDESLGEAAVWEHGLCSMGFLPKGLFDRFLCAALEWCRELQTQNEGQNHVDFSAKFTLCRSFAVLKVAGICFRMTAVPSNHYVTVEVISDDTDAGFETVINELLPRWRAVVASSLQSLAVAPFLPYMGQGGSPALLVPVSLPVRVMTSSTERVSLSMGSIGSSQRYHCFLSYRWGAFDKRFVTALHQNLACGIVRGHKVRVFLDDQEFQVADRFQQIFFESVLATEVFVPIVSPDALKRMVEHNPEKVDNVLLEWLTVLLLFGFPVLCNETLRYICPICLAGYSAVKTAVSAVIPDKTVNTLRGLFDLKGIELPPKAMKFLETVTVRDIVDGIMGFISRTWDPSTDFPELVADCADVIMKLFLRADGVDIPTLSA